MSSRFAEVSIYRMSIVLGGRQAYIDFHVLFLFFFFFFFSLWSFISFPLLQILPEDAGSLTDSGFYGEATLVLVVADMTSLYSFLI